jgi:spectinomycin phosphotransferase
MLTKPELNDEKIIACLPDPYGLDITEISFLPLGADFNTAVYQFTTTEKIDYLLQPKRTNIGQI